MGQAKAREKLRLEAMRAAILQQSERWAKPGSALEAQWYAEISGAEHDLVFTQRRAALVEGGMLPNDCHLNCILQERNDPTGAAKHVVGWWQQGDNYVLHSVIEQAGNLYCITPQHFDVQPFLFVRDSRLEWVKLGGLDVLRRDGQEVMIGLRKDPARFIRSNLLLVEKIAAGLDPIMAMEEVDAEIGPP